ncbi:hypothetical protein [Gemmatimonas sp.]|uniref:hypothetical protein n=1 Tax=Gemmatimonas sp. TaxID=1962908 RepID=UPI003564F28D
MSTNPPRRPSTLSADKFSAAKRPIGWAPAPRASTRPAETPMTWSARTAAAAATAPSGARAPGAAAVRRRAVTKGIIKSGQDSQIVTSLIIAFVLVVIVVASVRVRGGMRVTTSKDAVTGTLTAVHEKQSTFRLLNQRFATWRELQARGMRLSADQAVVKSNATASHWFISVRDSATGVICDKTGELFDEGPNDHRAVCRDSER